MKKFWEDCANAMNKYALHTVIVLLTIMLFFTLPAAYTPNGTVVINTNPSRALNTSYSSDATKTMSVSYTVVATGINPSLAGSATAYAYLETSPDGTTWTTTKEAGQTSSVGLAVAFALTNTQSTQLSGSIGPGLFFRVRSSVSGTGSTVTMPTNRQEELTY